MKSKVQIRLFMSLLFLFLAAAVWVGCEKNLSELQSQEVVSYSLENPVQVIETFNEGLLEQHKGQYVKGKLTIYKENDELIKFLIQSEDNQSNIRYSIELPNDLDLVNKLDGKFIEKAEVLYVHRGMLINDEENDFRLQLYLGDAPHSSIMQYGARLKLTGAGLIREKFSSDSDVNLMLVANVACRCCTYDHAAKEWSCHGGASSPPNGCDSGGIGATDCSITVAPTSGGSCNVSCEHGNACCWEEAPGGGN